MKGKKLKLPTAWIQFKGGIMWGAFYKRPTTKLFPEMSYVRYTPAKPAKVCKWQPGEAHWDDKMRFCPYCGGKIEVTR